MFKIISASAWLFLCGACFASAPAREGSAHSDDPAQVRVIHERPAVLNSQLDVENRYISTVLVNGANGVCSGTLVHARLVLTAAHCVCVEREDDGKRVIDGSACGATAMVTTIGYGASGAGQIRDSLIGDVRPHPDFKELFDEKGHLVSFKADLAAIFLREEVKGIVPAQLASTQVKVGEAVTLVGYGFYEIPGVKYGQRRFGANQVAAVSAGAFQVRKPGAHILAGDSGGPCFREGPRGAALVGVMMSGAMPGLSSSTFTNLLIHLKWLREQIRLADKATVSAGRESP